MGALWKEVKDWRHHWTTRSFFQGLILGLVFTLLDTGTDFSFVWSVSVVCPFNQTLENSLTTPCSFIQPESVESLTYTFIALPGVLLSFSAFQSLVTGLADRCCAGPINAKLQILGNFLALLFQFFLGCGLYFAAAFSGIWHQQAPPSVTEVYSFTIQAMAYVSAIFVISVKTLGVFCHGPQTKHLVLRTTDVETRCEAATQLCLVASIYFTSGTWTTASLLSGISSILVIGKVGVESFFKDLEQDSRLSKTSLVGKISVAISVLPVFVLTAFFKIGTIAITIAWDGALGPAIILVALVPPAVVICFIKTCFHLKDLSVTAISQGTFTELLSLHLWPCGKVGKRIGLGVTIYKVLLFSSVLLWIIKDPEVGRVDEVMSWFEVSLEESGGPQWS